MPISKKAIQFTACKACGRQTQVPFSYETDSKTYAAWQDLWPHLGICWNCFYWVDDERLHDFGIDEVRYDIKAYSYYLVG